MVLAARLGYLTPMHGAFQTLAEAGDELGGWLREVALPLWTTAGWDAPRGGFQEALTVDGDPLVLVRRSRVQSRQIWVCASAARLGFGERYGEIAELAFASYRSLYRRADGLFAFSAAPGGPIVDPTAALYEQAFTLLALSALHRLRPGGGYAAEGVALLAAMEVMRHPPGGWREAGARPFQANAHMHLLEAALAWEAVGEADWASVSDEAAGLALDRFIDTGTGVLREFFDADWRPLEETDGQLIEPGHQFEWATLLDAWGARRGRGEVRTLARRLYAAGLRGVDAAGVAVNALRFDLTIADAGARTWVQTEYLKAALRFGDEGEALRAIVGLWRYLDTPRQGVWRDKLTPTGTFVEEPSPATSLYHLFGAIRALTA
jgi:mannose-6-phosphate isomerase